MNVTLQRLFRSSSNKMVILVLAAFLTWGSIPSSAHAITSAQAEKQGGLWSHIGYGTTIASLVIGVVGLMSFGSCISSDCSESTINTSETLVYLGAWGTTLGVSTVAHGSYWQSIGIAHRRRNFSRVDGTVAFILSFPTLLFASASWYLYATDDDAVRITMPLALVGFAGTAWFGLRQHIRNGNWNIIPVSTAPSSFAIAPMITPEGGAGLGLGWRF